MTQGRHGAEPPPGGAWELPLGEAPLAFVDLEMTGLDPTKDRVIEVCVERVVGGEVVGRLETLVRFEGPPTTWDPSVHGIAPEAVASAPTFASVADRVLALLDGAVLVAHGAIWDVRFLEAELARAGRERKLPCFLDTLVLSRRVFAFPSHSLAFLAKELRAPVGRAHRAGDDVCTLRFVFERLVAALQPQSARDLWHTVVESRRARPVILGMLEDARVSALPIRVRYRPSGKKPVELVFVVTKLASDLDPPRAIGYLLPGRGRRELRTDRILTVEPASA